MKWINNVLSIIGVGALALGVYSCFADKTEAGVGTDVSTYSRVIPYKDSKGCEYLVVEIRDFRGGVDIEPRMEEHNGTQRQVCKR